MARDPLAIPTEEEQKKREDAAKREREKELEDIRFVLKSPEGRRVYYRLIDHCQPFKESYVVGMFDVTANNEGRRMVGNFLMAELLEADPERYFQMVREFKSAMVTKKIIEENREK